MASTPTSTTTADFILKDFYSGPVETIYNQAHVLFTEVSKGTETFTGRDVKFPVTLRRPMGVGSRANNYVPEAVASRGQQGTVTARGVYGSIELEGQIIEAATGNNSGAFIGSVDMEIDNTANALRRDLNRQVYGVVNSVNSNTGAVSQVNGTVGAVTDVVTDSNRYFEIGMPIWIGTATELANGTADKVSVAAVSTDGVTITLSASTTVADNDIIVRGDANSSGYNSELAGLNFAISTADDNFEGIDTGDYPEWKGIVNSNSGTARNLDLRLMALVIDTMSNASGRKPNMMIMHNSIRREYADLLVSDVRMQPKKLEGGWELLTFSNAGSPIPMYDDDMATYGNIYFLDLSTVKRYEHTPMKWDEKTGAIWQRVANKDSYVALMKGYLNFGYRQRNALAVLKDIDYSLTA